VPIADIGGCEPSFERAKKTLERITREERGMEYFSMAREIMVSESPLE